MMALSLLPARPVNQNKILLGKKNARICYRWRTILILCSSTTSGCSKTGGLRKTDGSHQHVHALTSFTLPSSLGRPRSSFFG